MSDKFCWNGSIISPDIAEEMTWEKLNYLRTENYIYQNIRTYKYAPIFLSEHIKIIDSILRDMYGISFAHSSERITSDIGQLLKANHFHNRSNVVTLYAFPNGDYMIEHNQQLYYDNFEIWHKKPDLEIFPCEYLFMGYTTAISKITCKYADKFVEKNGADIAVIENSQGILTNIDDEPLFIVFGNEVITSPLEAGIVNSLMRQLIIEACTQAQLRLFQTPITRDMLKQCDEAFTASPQGIIAIRRWREKSYFNLTPGKLIPYLNTRSSF